MSHIPISYYQSNGATSECLQDAEREFLLDQGTTSAHNQDMWSEFLLGSGYTGSIIDMKYEFWDVDGGALGGDSTILDNDEVNDSMLISDSWTMGD